MPANGFHFCDARGKIISSCFISRWILLGSFCETYHSYIWVGNMRQQLSENETLLPRKRGGEKRKKGIGKSVFPSENYVYMCEHISIIPKRLHIHISVHTGRRRNMSIWPHFWPGSISPPPQTRVGVFIIYFWVIDRRDKCFTSLRVPRILCISP